MRAPPTGGAVKQADTKLGRILRLLSLLESDREGRVGTLAIALRVSERTVFRYVSSLKACGVLIEFDPKRRRFYVSGESRIRFNFDGSEVGILLSVVSGVTSGSSILRHATELCNKIVAGVDSATRKSARSYQDTCYIECDSADVSPEVSRSLVTLHRCAVEKASVRLLIRSTDSTTLFSPYAVVFLSGLWFTIGRSSVHRKIVLLPLKDVTSLVSTGYRFEVPLAFKVNRYIKKHGVERLHLRKAS